MPEATITESKRAPSEDSKIAGAEAKRRKTEEVKSLPQIPLCPAVTKVGGKAFCDVNSKGGPEKALQVWSWWKKVTEEYPERLVVYLQRLTPHMKAKPRGERSEESFYAFPDYEYAEDYGNLYSWILQRYGSGNYRLYMNDQAMRTTLVEWYLNGIWEDGFPPVVNLDDVDFDNANNKAYVEFLRRTGKLPANGGSQMEPNQAAAIAQSAANAVQQQSNAAGMAGVATALANTVKDLATRPAPPAVDTSSIVKDTISVVLDGVRQQQAANSAAIDPVAHVKQVIDLAKTMQPPPAPQVDVAGLMKEARESAAAQARVTEELAKELRERDREERNALRAEIRELKQRPADDPLASLEKTFSLVERIKGLGASSAEEDDGKTAKEPWWAGLAQSLLPAFAPLIGVGAQLLASKLQPQVAAVPHQQVPQHPGIVPVNQPVQNPQEAEMSAREAGLWSMIGAQLQNHFATGKSGVDFALWFIEKSGLGEANYRAIASGFTRDQVILSMKRYAPMVAQAVLLADGTPQGPFLRFMDEFMDQGAVSDAMNPDEIPTIEAEAIPETPSRPMRVRKSVAN